MQKKFITVITLLLILGLLWVNRESFVGEVEEPATNASSSNASEQALTPEKETLVQEAEVDPSAIDDTKNWQISVRERRQASTGTDSNIDDFQPYIRFESGGTTTEIDLNKQELLVLNYSSYRVAFRIEEWDQFAIEPKAYHSLKKIPTPSNGYTQLYVYYMSRKDAQTKSALSRMINLADYRDRYSSITIHDKENADGVVIRFYNMSKEILKTYIVPE